MRNIQPLFPFFASVCRRLLPACASRKGLSRIILINLIDRKEQPSESEREREGEMVLWEITLGTAYFLGLRRTYKLALRIQRRIVGPNHPEIRQFLHRRIRSVFDVAVRVHRSTHLKDIEVGRNFGNWILRWLDHVKPSAQIHPQPARLPTCGNHIPKHVASYGQAFRRQRPLCHGTYQERKVRSFFAPWNIHLRTFPTIAMMMRPLRPAGMNGQYRYASHYMPSSSALDYRIDRVQSIFRKDIAMWMLHN